MSGSIGTAAGSWFAVGREQFSGPERGSPDDRAHYMCWLHVSVLELGAYETAPSCARLHTRNVLAEWQIPRDLIADAEMICSELATNALRATWALPEHVPIALRLLANAERLVIEVWDAHPGQPARQSPVGSAESGRGLQIVDSLSNRWGARRLNADLKAVWAELLIARP